MTTKEELQELLRQIDLKIDEMTDVKESFSDMIDKLREKVTVKAEINEQYGRWKPSNEEYYFYKADNGRIYKSYWADENVDLFRWSVGNVYKTREHAEQALERMKIRTQLEDIALRLNKGQKITFGIDEGYKYYLRFAFDYSEINQCETRFLKSQDVIYCLDENFIDVAIAEIGKERLAKYLRGNNDR